MQKKKFGKANLSGLRIRAARAMQNPKMSQDDLIARLQIENVKISKNILSRIETGDRYVTDLELAAFARVFKVSTAWLMNETNNSDK